MSPQESMPVRIPSTKIHREFGEIVRRVYGGKEHFIVEKDGLPVMAIISMDEYERFMDERSARLQRFQQFSQALGRQIEQSDLSEEDIEAEVEAARQQMYQEQHGS